MISQYFLFGTKEGGASILTSKREILFGFVFLKIKNKNKQFAILTGQRWYFSPWIICFGFFFLAPTTLLKLNHFFLLKNQWNLIKQKTGGNYFGFLKGIWR